MAAVVSTSLPFEKLSGAADFSVWQIRVRAQLSREGLSEWLVKVPATDSNAEKLQDARAHGTLVLSLERHILAHVATLTTTKDTWDRLQDLFRSQDGGNKVLKHRELFSLKLLSLDDGIRKIHIQKMLELFNDLEMLQTPFTPLQKAMIFLSSLGSIYQGFIDSYNNANDRDLNFNLLCSQLESWLGIKRNAEKLDEKVKVSPHVPEVSDPQTFQCNVICFKCRQVGHYAKQCRLSKGKQKPNEGVFQSQQQKSYNKFKGKKGFYKQSSEADTACLSVNNMFDHDCENCFVLDSGADHCLVKNAKLLRKLMYLKPCKQAVQADGSVLTLRQAGSLYLQALKCKLDNVYYNKNLKKNILSIAQITSAGLEVTFKDGYCCIQNANQGVDLKIPQRDGVYLLCPEQCNQVCCPILPKALHSNCVHYLHRVLGHRQYRDVIMTAKLLGFKLDSCVNYLDCLTCNQTKVKAFPLRKESKRETMRRFEKVEIDLCGPFQKSNGGHEYFLNIVDTFSRFGFVYFLKKKSEAEKYLKEWVNMVCNQYKNTPLLCIKSDHGGEWSSNSLKEFLAEKGIRHVFTEAYRSVQNCFVERRNRSLQDLLRALLHDSGLSQRFWAEAVSYANTVLNYTYCDALKNIPYVMFHGTKPDLKSLHVFGSHASVYVHKSQRQSKRDQCWVPARFLGLENSGPCYRFLDLSQKGGVKVIASRSAKFSNSQGWERLHLNKYVFEKGSQASKPEKSIVLDPIHKSGVDVGSQTESEHATTVFQQGKGSFTHVSPELHDYTDSSSRFSGQPKSSCLKNESLEMLPEASDEEEQEDFLIPRRSKRVSRPPDRLQISNAVLEQSGYVFEGL